MTPRDRWRRTWHELRAAVTPTIAFTLMTALAMGLFFALVIGSESMDSQDVLVMAAIATTTFGGITLGQLFALLRLRTWVVAVLTGLFWGAGVALTAAGLPVPESVGVATAIVFVLGPFFALAGLWSLQANMGILATWAPMVFVTGSIIVIAEKYTGSVAAWHGGEKWAIWDLFSAPVLLVGVVFLLFYLAARERHRLTLWSIAPGGPDLPKVRATRGSTFRLGCGGLSTALILGILLTGGAALTAPYLWRTGPAEEGDSPTPQGPEPQPAEEPEPPPPSQGCQQQPPPQGEDPGENQTPDEKMEEAVRQAGLSLVTLILAMILGLAGLLIFIPPVRRGLLLRHLRRPLWPVPPTRQVLQAWRVVEIALADYGIRRRPGDSAESLARRAISELPSDIDTDALLHCARVTDRVTFGLGVEATDPEDARRTAELAYHVVWELLSEGGRVWSVYRFL